MKIIHARVYTEGFGFRERDVCTEGPLISEESTDGEVFDAAGAYLIPGLIDIHLHGCAGHDFCEGTHEAMRAMAEYEAFHGITSIFPATMTLPEEELLRICRAFASYPGGSGASLHGIYLEGPFVSEARCGAQNAAYVRRPDADLFRRLQGAAGGWIRYLTLAPELDGAEACVRELKDEVVLSAGHTAADYKQAAEAFSSGIRHVTHLYNAMTGFGHRAPGVVGAAMEDGRVEAELICDGVHIHPAVVRQTLRSFGAERILFISDSMEAAGMPDGAYTLGGQPVRKRGARAELSDGTIAGSVTNLMDCLRTAVLRMGIPLETAVRCASVNPARSAGIYDRVGSIAPGKLADLVLLREGTLETEAVILRGKRIH